MSDTEMNDFWETFDALQRMLCGGMPYRRMEDLIWILLIRCEPPPFPRKAVGEP